MLPTDLSQLSIESLARLRENAVPEGRTLEYKRELPGDSPEDKREFLADVSAFANAHGGHLLFGVEEVDGSASASPGVSGVSEDGVRQRLANLCQDGIEPRLLGLEIRGIRVATDSYVFVVYVPRSWIGPHRVIFRGHGHFYVRDPKGKHPMDTDELREAFTRASELIYRIRDLRTKRCDLVLTRNDGPRPLAADDETSVRLLLHLVPLTAVASTDLIDIDRHQGMLRTVPMHAPEALGMSWAVNLDGHLNYTDAGSGDIRAFAQFCRNGMVEYAAAHRAEKVGSGERIYWAENIEQELGRIVRTFLDAQKVLGVLPPIYLFLTFGNASRTRIVAGERDRLSARGMADRWMLELPEVVIESFDVDLSVMLAPTFGVMWNAFGRHRPTAG